MSEPISKEEHYSVRWNSYSNNLIHMLTEHRSQDRLADVTLVCEGQFLKAHKIILSSCSTYFQDFFKTHGGICGSIIHPFIVFTGEKYHYLSQIIEFMYQGEIKVSESDLEGILAMGEKFQVKGLCSVRVKNKIDKSKSDNSHVSNPQASQSPVTLQTSQSASPVTQNATPTVVQNVGAIKQSTSPPVPSPVDFTPKPPLIPIPAHQIPLLKPINHLNEHGKMFFPKVIPGPSGNAGVLLAARPMESLLDPNRLVSTNKQTYTSQKEAAPVLIEHENTLQPVRKKIRPDSSAMFTPSGKDSPSESIRFATPPEPSLVKDIGPELKPQKPPFKVVTKEDLTAKLQDIPMDDKKSEDKQQSKSLNPFMIFASEWRKKLQVEHPGESNKEISVRLGNLWKNLSAETKQSYYRTAQWQREPGSISSLVKSIAGKKVMQRRNTVDSSMNWKDSADGDGVEIIELDLSAPK